MKEKYCGPCTTQSFFVKTVGIGFGYFICQERMLRSCKVKIYCVFYKKTIPVWHGKILQRLWRANFEEIEKKSGALKNLQPNLLCPVKIFNIKEENTNGSYRIFQFLTSKFQIDKRQQVLYDLLSTGLKIKETVIVFRKVSRFIANVRKVRLYTRLKVEKQLLFLKNWKWISTCTD